ncbi:MAG: prepilin-type N-terminal cleavage/methylation domain-containing protein [Acidobacteriota bacterium]|nr:prepilin-type N-terminal cleavage/methylation domain-containing protein [Acidobacteriota bacterium]
MRFNKHQRATDRYQRIGERGFSLIELMIVIAIIGILIAVGVTGWKAAVRSANEAAAIKTLRTIAEQQMLYYNSHQRSKFGTFDEMLKEGLLDTRFAGTTPVVDGYVYTMRVIPKSTTAQAGYAVNADPQVTEGVGATGKNHFFLDSDSNTIHVNETQAATVTDPPIGQ